MNSPAEQVRQRRMVVPVADQAAQQVGPAQKRTVGRRRAAEHDVVAAAGAGVPAVEHELLGAQPAEPRLLVQAVEVIATSSSQLRAGCTLTSITPGSGVTLMTLSRGSCGRRVALDDAPAVRAWRPCPRRGDQLQ